jgi:hypothetical protein
VIEADWKKPSPGGPRMGSGSNVLDALRSVVLFPVADARLAPRRDFSLGARVQRAKIAIGSPPSL